MMEYGGYFELEKLGVKEYHNSLLAFNYARTALRYLIKTQKIRKIFLPYYICDSVIDAVKKEKIDINFYHINKNFLPDISVVLNKNERLLLVNYFGLLSNEIIEQQIEKFKYVVVDNTHAFFCRLQKDIECIYSCRKFFGVPDGGYLSGVLSNSEIKLETDNSYERLSFLVGRLEDNASKHYSEFRLAEDRAAEEDIKWMSKFTHRILSSIDYDAVKEKRKNNFLILHKYLNQFNLLKISIPFGLYGYPLLLSNSKLIRENLLKKKIYIPTLWSNVLEGKADNFEKNLAENLLLLPIDQRYDKKDMNFLVASVREELI